MKTASNIIKIALKQKGCKGNKFWKYYGVPSGTAWCGIFVSWVFNEAKANDLFLSKKKNPAYVPNIDEWGKKDKLIVNKNNGKKGDIIIFDWGNDGTRDHVGLVVDKNKDGTYKTIEGNTNGGMVAERTRYKSDIMHFIRPKYEEEKPKKKYNLKRKLKKGCTGEDVKKLQKKLKIKADGIFGDQTLKALKKYQYDKGWTPSGVVRTKTAHSFGWLYKGK